MPRAAMKETSMQTHDPASTAAATDRAGDETGDKIRRFALIVAIVLVIGFVAMHFIKSHEAAKVARGTAETSSAPLLVNVITVEKAPASLTLTLPGATAAWYESTIYARVDGYVGTWTSDIGDTVKKNQVMATIETPDLDAELAAALAKVKADEAQVESAQAALVFAKTTYERWRDSPKGVVSEQERDSTKAGNDRAVAQLGVDKAQLALDRAVADRYTALSKFKQVTAPYDGKVIERQIDIGNLVTAGSTANTTLLYRVSQNDPMRVFVDVPQRVAPEMRPGVEARITASNLVGQVFVGKIARTADAIDRRARTLRVEVDIPNSKQVLVPGMYVDVGFDVPTGGLPQVPAAALVFRSSGPQIAQVDRDQRVRFHPVTIARDNGSSVEIGSGLQAGEMIALNISSQIVEGDKVQVSESKASAADGPALGK
jgi:RND family efflux transporter MFP subunit